MEALLRLEKLGARLPKYRQIQGVALLQGIETGETS